MKSKIAICIPIILIKVYQYILSPMKDCFFGPTVSCRFHPSCSHYSLSAFQEHGLLKGTYLTIKRLAKCHPAHPGGLDPVPTNKK